VAARRAEAPAAETDSISGEAAAARDHVVARRNDFFEVACAHDLEGVVAKLASGRYHADGTSTNW
jgi:ATP-dependent DNA ligase